MSASSSSRTVWPTARISVSASASAAASTWAFPISAVMPRPTAAGVLGMARTMGVRSPSTAWKLLIGVPAAMERKTVVPLPSAASRGSASPIDCGLTASTATAGSEGRSAFSRSPASASSVSLCAGFGSRTVIASSASPLAIQPSSNAVPILPQPSKTTPRPEISDRSMAPLPGPGPGRGAEIRRDRRLRPSRCQAPSPASRRPRRRAGTQGRTARRPSPPHGPCR